MIKSNQSFKKLMEIFLGFPCSSYCNNSRRFSYMWQFQNRFYNRKFFIYRARGRDCGHWLYSDKGCLAAPPVPVKISSLNCCGFLNSWSVQELNKLVKADFYSPVCSKFLPLFYYRFSKWCTPYLIILIKFSNFFKK